MKKITNFILLALLTASIIGITSCQKTAITTEEETENNFFIQRNKDIVIYDITFEALYDSCEVWNANEGQNVIMEEGAVIFNHSTTADSINYVFNSDDAIYYNPIETGIEELKSVKDIPQNSVDIEINTTVSSTQQYVAFVDNLEIANITGNVTTIDYNFPSSPCLEENGVDINYEPTTGTVSVSPGILTQMQADAFVASYGGHDIPLFANGYITVVSQDTLKASFFSEALEGEQGVVYFYANENEYPACVKLSLPSDFEPEIIRDMAVNNFFNAYSTTFQGNWEYFYSDGVEINQK